jgi:PAS domain S-box-containing protein
MLDTNGLSSQQFAKLKSAIDEAAIIAITDKQGVITYVNHKFCAISKYASEELIGNTHQIVNSQFHSKEFFTDLWRTISAGKIWEGEIRNRAKDGTLYWVHTTIVPFLDDNKQPEKYVAVRYEITESKASQEQLKLYSKKLEVSNQELQSFASIAAHDLQEPLRKIQAFSDRLKLKAKDELSEDNYDYLNRIQNSAHRMQTLINDLLSYSRVTTKAQPFCDVDLNTILTNVISDLEVRIEKCKGAVRFESLPTIEADSTQMQQLFMNLLTNALKFSKPGIPPLVTIEAKILQESPLGESGTACQITVKDNGIGFDEKYLTRIFTIFQRLHGQQTYEGTGIGLAVCRKIIDRHGGFITARSQPNEGATFIVTLPVTKKR